MDRKFKLKFMGPTPTRRDPATGDIWEIGEVHWVDRDTRDRLMGFWGGGCFQDRTRPPEAELAKLPQCKEPGCERRVYWGAPGYEICRKHFCKLKQARRKLNRLRGRCGCGRDRSPGFKTCADCRILRRAQQLRYRAGKRRAAGPAPVSPDWLGWRRMREQAGLSRGQLALQSGVSIATIERLERQSGHIKTQATRFPLYRRPYKPHASTVRKLLKILG